MSEIKEYKDKNDLNCLLDDDSVFKNMKIEDFPKFVTQTIKLLSRSIGVNLIFGEDTCNSSYNPETNTVMIPPPPAFTKKNKSIFTKKLAQWRGILNHEVGHAQFTKWHTSRKDTTTDSSKKIYGEKFHKFVDLFENGRMERVACENYPGMIKDLLKLEDVLKDIITEYHQKLTKEDKWNDMMTLFYGLRMAVNGYEPVVSIPKHLEVDWEACMGFIREAWDTNDEQETIEISIKAHKFFEAREKKSKKDSNEKTKKIQMKRSELEKLMQDQENQKGEKGEENVNVKINDPKGEEDEKEEEDKKSKKGEADLEIDIIEDEEEAKEKSEFDIIEEELKELEEERKKIEDLKKEIKELKEECKKVEKIKKLKDVDPVKKYKIEKLKEKAVYRSILNQVIPLPLHDYVDLFEVLPDQNKGNVETSSLLNECLNKLSILAQTFINKVRSSKHVGVRTFQGRLSTKSIYKYNYSNNIFKTKAKRKKKDAAVSIVIDCSGSMSGLKIEASRKAALILGEIMSRAKVEFELLGFTAPFHGSFNFSPFTRKANLIHYRFAGSKDWNLRKHGVVDGFLEEGLLDNDDGESLRHFADNLSKSKKERKMMIVISDGEPRSIVQSGNTDIDLLKTIQEIRDNQIEIFAIGLDTCVSKYYGAKNSIRLSGTASNVEIVEAVSTFISMIENY